MVCTCKIKEEYEYEILEMYESWCETETVVELKAAEAAYKVFEQKSITIIGIK